MIFAGNTFNFVQASRRTCVSRSLGTILACPWSLLWHSLEYKSRMAFHPKVIPVAAVNVFVPPVCDENRAFIIFFNYHTSKYVARSTNNLNSRIYLVTGAYKPVNMMRWIKRIYKPWFNSVRVRSIRVSGTIHTTTTMCCF